MNIRCTCAALAAMLLAAGPVPAEDEVLEPGWGRAEIWLGVSRFPGLADIRPLAGGDFDTTGLAIGGAWHWRVKQFANSELLAGVDCFVGATDSSVGGVISDLAVRHIYLGASLKWALGPRRNVHLDAGVGYHGLDMAELGEFIYGLEHVAWADGAGGAFVGATWDAGAGRPGRTSGLSLGFKVHFVDFGRVNDEDTFFVPILGDDAGRLDGPVYMLQIGYGGR